MSQNIEQAAAEIGNLSDLATAIAADAAAAHAAQRAAEVALIEAVLAKLPAAALNAIGTRPQVRYVLRHVGTKHADTTRDHAVWRGLHIDYEGAVGPSCVGDGCDTHGTYVGGDLFLTAEGFRVLDYTGAWSNWQGQTSSWESTDEAVTVVRAVELAGAEAIVECIASALRRYIDGGAKKTAAAAQARAAKLTALAALLR